MAFPAWIPCPDCDNFLCSIHRLHAHECECPSIEEWGDVDPYSAGGKKITIGPRKPFAIH